RRCLAGGGRAGVGLGDVGGGGVVPVVVLKLPDGRAGAVVPGGPPPPLPAPADAPPTAAQRASSWATFARPVAPAGTQHSTADGRPQVERAAQATIPRVASAGQPPRWSAVRNLDTQRTYCPWVPPASHPHAAASAAATSSGHGMGPGRPRRAAAPAARAHDPAR